MAQNHRQNHRHTDGHGDSMTNSAQWGRVGEKLSEILSPMTRALARMINCQIESDTSQLSQIIVRQSEFKSCFECKKNK